MGDLIYEIADMMLTPVGWVFFVSLGFLVLLIVITQRTMP